VSGGTATSVPRDAACGDVPALGVGWSDPRAADAVVLAVAVAGLSLLATAWLGVKLTPDVGLYLGSGFGLYPSPLGTALGSAGLAAFCVAHAAAVGGLAYLIARARPRPAALLLSLPVLWWVVPLGVDSIAAVLLVLDVVVISGFAWLALGFHFAALPLVGLLNASRSRFGWFVVLGLWVLAVLLLAVTPYGSALALDPWTVARAIPAFLTVMALALAPALVLDVVRPAWALAGGTAAVVLYATTAHVRTGEGFGLSVFASTRYALPLTAVLLATSGWMGERSGLRQLRGKD